MAADRYGYFLCRRSPVGVALTHRFTRRREEATAARKRYDELYFISTELVFCWSVLHNAVFILLMNQGNMTKMDVLGLSILYLKSISSPLLGTGVLCHRD